MRLCSALQALAHHSINTPRKKRAARDPPRRRAEADPSGEGGGEGEGEGDADDSASVSSTVVSTQASSTAQDPRTIEET